MPGGASARQYHPRTQFGLGLAQLLPDAARRPHRCLDIRVGSNPVRVIDVFVDTLDLAGMSRQPPDGRRIIPRFC
jgi:hypothetical protein